METDKTYTLSFSCVDRPGIVAAVSQSLFEGGGNIVEAQQFDDALTGRFFMRVVFQTEESQVKLQTRVEQLTDQWDMTPTLRKASDKQKVLILVSKFDHCLGDLLYRTRVGELNMEVVGIVSNHPRDALTIAAGSSIDFHHLPMTKETKPQQEQQIRDIVEETGAELVVLARYMQILSDEMSAYLSGRCINIHHSFLPGFKGAKPYHQAHARGVKIIGATAHYVTADLDEGPIICQDIEHIDHSDTPMDLVRKGRNIEQRVLARAVYNHINQRVLLNGDKTVVF